jgi:hypothetical protein
MSTCGYFKTADDNTDLQKVNKKDSAPALKTD